MQGERGRCWAQRRQLLGVQIVHAHSEKKTLCVQLTHANDALQCKTQSKDNGEPCENCMKNYFCAQKNLK